MVVNNFQEWVKYNHLTATYDTLDNTKVAAEIIDSIQCLADILYIAQIRAKQRLDNVGEVT